ncbi:MAG: flagellar hook capping protein [Planctomycetota bacterium]|nr:flagellar hook capping protein [Planctomycetota bacterium]
MDAISAVGSASKIQTDYMKILVSQLQNQNPLEPMDNNEMATQLAMLSQLQQLESMNTNFSQVLSNVEGSYANSLLGKNVAFLEQTDTGESVVKSGVVSQVYKQDGKNMLVIGDQVFGLDEVVAVRN